MGLRSKVVNRRLQNSPEAPASFYRAAVIFLLLLLVWPLLAGCADEPAGPADRTAGTITGPAGRINSPGNPFNPTRDVQTVPPTTPTYTPLPVTATPLPTATPPVSPGGKLTGALLSDALTLHPYKANNQSGESLVSLLYAAPLTRRDPQTLQPQPAAAESWTINATTVTFTLREGLKWSDGKPLTSADYLWTYQQARKPENGWPYAAEVFHTPDGPGSGGIESYEAPDARTIKIKLRTASSDMVTRADALEPLPRHVWSSLDWNDQAKNPQMQAPTVVSGPWKLKEWKPGNTVALERNPASTVYPVPRLENLNFAILPDSQIILQKIKNNEVDFFSPAAAELAAFEQLPNIQAYSWGPARPTWYYAGFNFRKPYLQDKLLRQALAWAVDRRAIIDKLAFGQGQALNSSVSPWHPAFTPFTARYELNPVKARELLAQAGYNLKDGKLIAKDGQELPALKLVFNAPSPLYEGIAATLRDNFKAFGMRVELRNFDFDNYKRFLASPSADFDLFLSGWTGDYAPEYFGEVWRTAPELNSGTYENSRLLDMYAKALGEPDATRRKEWLAQVQAIEAEELPYIFLFAERGRLIANKRAAGFTTGLIGPDKNLYTDWFVTR